MDKKIPALSVFLILFSMPGHGEIYKWKDEQGNMHYSDTPRDMQSSLQVNAAETKSSSTEKNEDGRDERRRRLADAMQEDRLKKKEEKEKARAERDQKNKQCVYAKDRLRRMEDSGYLYELDKDGKRIVLSDEQRKADIDQYRQQIRQHCGQ